MSRALSCTLSIADTPTKSCTETHNYVVSRRSQVLEVLSGVRGEPMETLAAQVYENTRRVFFPDA